ncbi:family 65 glycosyl hydrolase [Rhodococcus hoagii]|uniref:Family 65 glycosyl hydrolase n=1 Tax=Rhodococcus hoagii TaxID=43767 RepID=A0AAE3BCP5_RHOHA|nr:family 65 glycosyl hydrolase [Prescottella equi]MBM4554596.1 family 65 glycosyl hydrolase [Prescottella equi]MBM4717028.1 family 65 glycosyl hydrolase [Prescottella equi]NKR49792.1 family 65 glycosyl hydrolase [Prescottella equi]NKR65021.1 family 65 glycosyl hydrolase [Prescottella equi]
MITHPAFTVEPWSLRATSLDLDVLAQSESLFALANGHLGWRGNLDEGDPHGLPGSYLSGVYEVRPMPYAEPGYGYPDSGETIINVTDGKIVRLLVDDEPFDVRRGRVLAHEQELDLRAGVLRRKVEWRSPAGRTVRLTTTRLVSFTQRTIGAIDYTVEALDGPAHVVLQSELVANEPMPQQEADPRAAAVLAEPLVAEEHFDHEALVQLTHTTAESGLRIAVAMDHEVTGPGVHVEVESYPDQGRVTITSELARGERVRMVKYVSHAWSARRTPPAMRDQVAGELTLARESGWDGLVSEQRAYLDRFWAHADVTVDGDPEVQQAVRFALFHILQASARAEGTAIASKGLTGRGYDGHAFWDTEMFVLPVLTSVLPQAVADALGWRHSTLPRARERARQLGFAGAAFPWRTITGKECSGYWPAGAAAFHVNAAIARAAIGYIRANGNGEFERTVGLDLLVETARLWRSLGYFDERGTFRIDGVTGPDEYSALVRNDLYTNLMARENLDAAVAVVERHRYRMPDLGVTDEEVGGWRTAAARMYVPYDERRGVHPQSSGFTDRQVWDFVGTPPEHYPLLLHYPYFDLYRKQVVKQADVVLAMQWVPDEFTEEQRARNFAYYERLTVRDSSLSACSQAVVAADVGALDLAYDYLGETALIDLYDLEHNTSDGLHLASLAGIWIALVQGFGGARRRRTGLTFRPTLPRGIERLAFGVAAAGCRLRVQIEPTETRYHLVVGDELTVHHDGEPVTLHGNEVRVMPTVGPPAGPVVTQPAGRAPVRRRPGTGGRPSPAD